MTWFRVDAGMRDHPAWIGCPKAAKADWLDLGTYAAQHLTDGHLPQEIVRRITTPQTLKWLLSHGRLHAPDDHCDDCPNNGQFYLHAYLERNPSRAQLEAEREASRKRMSEWRSRR